MNTSINMACANIAWPEEVDPTDNKIVNNTNQTSSLNTKKRRKSDNEAIAPYRAKAPSKYIIRTMCKISTCTEPNAPNQ